MPGVGPLGEPIHAPIIEYLNFAVEDPRSRFPGQGFGRASLGGHMYRGQDIKWLRGRFVQGDFALNFLDGQILVAKEMPKGKLWKLRRAFVFDPSDPVKSGFVKSIGQDADGELYAVTGTSRRPASGPGLEDHRRLRLNEVAECEAGGKRAPPA